MSTARISLIVPTLNEAKNLPLLLPRVDAALCQYTYEVLVVDDDSKDQTPAVCQELSGKYPLKLLVRRPPKDGLSGAVLHGMAQAQGEVFVVMDADLQHPPEKLPELIAPLLSRQADFTIGSRYVAGGGTEQAWGLFRVLNSKVATWLARPFAGRTSDPMSGFFALRRETYQGAQRLTPLGYKIALELMCKCRVQNVREIPIHFGLREHGESKLSLSQQFRYLEHLSRLYDFKYPRASPITKFLIATGIGWLVAFALYVALLGRGMPMLRADIIAYAAAIAMTAVFHIRYVRTQREFLATATPWRDFWIISLAEWIACALAALWLRARVADLGADELFVLSVAAATLVRYMLRKEFLQDVRGLRREMRRDELT